MVGINHFQRDNRLQSNCKDDSHAGEYNVNGWNSRQTRVFTKVHVISFSWSDMGLHTMGKLFFGKDSCEKQLTQPSNLGYLTNSTNPTGVEDLQQNDRLEVNDGVSRGDFWIWRSKRMSPLRFIAG